MDRGRGVRARLYWLSHTRWQARASMRRRLSMSESEGGGVRLERVLLDAERCVRAGTLCGRVQAAVSSNVHGGDGREGAGGARIRCLVRHAELQHSNHGFVVGGVEGGHAVAAAAAGYGRRAAA